MLGEFSAIVEHIYDAALDPTLWKATLLEIAAYLNVDRATLLVEDAEASDQIAFIASFDDPEWIERYRTDYIRLNPMRIATGATAKSGDITLTTDFMTHEEFQRTRYYSEWMQTRQLVDHAVAMIERTPSLFVVLAVHRHETQGPGDETLRERLALLTPHVAKSLSISRALDRARLDIDTFARLLDRLQSAFFLLNEFGHIVQSSAGARHLLDAGVVTRNGQGILRMPEVDANAQLDLALALARDASDKADAETASISFQSPTGDKYAATVLSLNGGKRHQIGVYYNAIIAVVVRKIGLDLLFDPAPLAHAYDLTPRECTVLFTLVETGGVPETAAILGVAQATVKSHLKAIFRKTGTNKQSDLVKLAASVGPPIENQN